MSTKPAAARRKSAILTLFVCALFVLSLMTVSQLRSTSWDDGLALLLVALLTALASSWSVRISALRIELTPTDPFVLFAMAALGTHAAAVVAVVAVVGGTLWRPRRRRPIQLAFNLAALPLTATAAGFVFAGLGGHPGLPAAALLAPLGAATLTYYLMNTGLTAGAIALSEKDPFLRVWRRTLIWTLWPMATALTLALCMILLAEAMGPWGLAFGLPPVLALAATQQVSRSRLERVRADDEGLPATAEAT